MKILVVDDDVHIRELFRDALNTKGYETVTVPTGQQALALIEKETFDLVLLDIYLMDAPGITVLKQIRASHKSLPIVICSGGLTAENEKAAREAGANEALRKDIGIPQLVERIEKITRAKSQIIEKLHRREGKTILIVDDDWAIRNVLNDFFRAKGYQTLLAESGEQALKIVENEKISVVLLDINMPGIGGLETLKKLLALNPRLGVVMLTGEQEDEEIKKALALGAYSYVLKPFDFLYLEVVVMSKLMIAET